MFERMWTRQSANVNLGSSTVSRVVDSGKEDPEFEPRPVGFVKND